MNTCTNMAAKLCFAAVCISMAAAPASAGTSLRDLLVGPLYTGTPYLAVVTTLPGNLEAENFDVGGQGISYNNIYVPGVEDTMPPNVIRQEELGAEVAIQINSVDKAVNPAASEGPGEMATGMGVTGEWMRYTVDVPVAGTFATTWRLATYNPDDPAGWPLQTTITVGTGEEADPCALPGSGGLDVAAANTGDWKQFADFPSLQPIELPAGQSVLTVCLTNVANFELNKIVFEDLNGAGTAAPTSAPTMAPTMAPVMV